MTDSLPQSAVCFLQKLAMQSVARLRRSANDRWIAGVCGGVADYFEIDPTIVRIAWIVATFIYGVGLGLYIIIWIASPER